MSKISIEERVEIYGPHSQECDCGELGCSPHDCSYGQPDGADDFIKECDCD